MLRSMTAFGRSTLSIDGGELLCEIRSLNHRYLDISIRLPETLRAVESEVRERLTKSVHRGKIELSLRVNEVSDSTGGITINTALLAELAQAAGQVEGLTSASCIVDSVRLLQWPGVLVIGSGLSDIPTDAAQTAFAQALQDFMATREREGQQMAALLMTRNAQIHELLAKLRQRRPQVLAKQREKLLVRLGQLAVDHDEDRLEQELVHVAQRLDIDEELDRLDAHVSELSLALQRDEPVGRRLDFLMQEFNRETNTISSKSSDKDTTAIAVDMKVLIEQMREQVQNVE
ncbi:YicC/YloC family endoribonuclease [Granulosicoccus antarcticus]|uniref:YicC family protein n=1 Tax=Granulosicoccus antarcticus IMCC3135 TaxID=1192854 RepID=A0A2Z2NKS1_9GAMM|nr:YicC/YloC family endoribonuclease [Granulosicoccus antarcticus]ASJ70468.1 hypothetical protein IMCC3135_01745 [Granulosicoccus antarcticus IMCC3135]